MRFVVLASLLLTGCADVTATPPSPSECNAQAWVRLVGQPATAALVVPEPKRLYRLGDPVTMDFRPDRVNVVLSDTDTIIDVKCG